MDNVCGLDYMSIQFEILQVGYLNSLRSPFQLGLLPFPLKDAWRLIVYSLQIVSTHCLSSILELMPTKGKEYHFPVLSYKDI